MDLLAPSLIKPVGWCSSHTKLSQFGGCLNHPLQRRHMKVRASIKTFFFLSPWCCDTDSSSSYPWVSPSWRFSQISRRKITEFKEAPCTGMHVRSEGFSKVWQIMMRQSKDYSIIFSTKSVLIFLSVIITLHLLIYFHNLGHRFHGDSVFSNVTAEIWEHRNVAK